MEAAPRECPGTLTSLPSPGLSNADWLKLFFQCTCLGCDVPTGSGTWMVLTLQHRSAAGVAHPLPGTGAGHDRLLVDTACAPRRILLLHHTANLSFHTELSSSPMSTFQFFRPFRR